MICIHLWNGRFERTEKIGYHQRGNDDNYLGLKCWQPIRKKCVISLLKKPKGCVKRPPQHGAG